MIIEIKFSHGESNIFIESNEAVSSQETVIFRTEKGQNYGKVLRSLPDNAAVETTAQLVRIANQDDFNRIALIEQESAEAKEIVAETVAEIGLEMKIISAAFNLEKSQIFIAFTAEKRVDFRELLKELAVTFRSRIELRQVGPRDAAKIYGGVGPCGRPLCCSEFIYEFPNVSIKMAKNQTLSLKQSKLNGMCGRLMCCLTYEDEFYKEAQVNFPDFGQTITTQDGTGRVIGLNILKNQIKVKFENSIMDYDVTELEGVHG
ncbi:MAG: regulatory iron-sulfur-containing complex subunit RicT [Lactococcus sp.]